MKHNEPDCRLNFSQNNTSHKSDLLAHNEELKRLLVQFKIENSSLVNENKLKSKRANELKNAIEELEKVKEMQKIFIKGLSDMLHFVSHQLSQPSTNIAAITELMQIHKNDPEELEDLLSLLNQSSMLLNEHIKKLTLAIMDQEERKRNWLNKNKGV